MQETRQYAFYRVTAVSSVIQYKDTRVTWGWKFVDNKKTTVMYFGNIPWYLLFYKWRKYSQRCDLEDYPPSIVLTSSVSNLIIRE